MFRVVPDYIADEINATLDKLIAAEPAAAADRDVLYSQLLDWVDQHGYVPKDVTVGKRTT